MRGVFGEKGPPSAMSPRKKAPPPAPLLLVGADDAFINSLAAKFSRSGHRVVVERTRAGALAIARSEYPVAIVVDGDIDSSSGHDFCRLLKSRVASAATILVRATDDAAEGPVDAVAHDGATAGEIVELTAATMEKISSARSKTAGVFRVDRAAHSVFFRGQALRLTATEYRLLAMLVENAGQTVSRGVLLRDVWGYAEKTPTRTLDVHVRRVRAKLRGEEHRVETVHLQGYRLRTEQEV